MVRNAFLLLHTVDELEAFLLELRRLVEAVRLSRIVAVHGDDLLCSFVCCLCTRSFVSLALSGFLFICFSMLQWDLIIILAPP